MSERAAALAAKLSSEGERTFAFFQSLPESAWTKPCYSEGAAWTVRGALEHLIVSECALLALYRAMVDNAGTGAEPDFDVQVFNHKHTGTFDQLDHVALLAKFGEVRAITSTFAASLNDTQLALEGNHPAMGRSRLEAMLKMVPLHNTMHIKDVKKALTEIINTGDHRK